MNIVFAITFFLLIYVTFQYFRLHKEKKLNERYTENLRIAKDYAEFETLKLQLHPHFLFNTLNTLNHLISPANTAARKYLQVLADVYRYILKNTTKELVLLNEELNFSEQYFYLLTIRYGQAIQFRIKTDALNADDYLVIPISIQILIENAIKHNHFTIEEPLDLFVAIDKEYVTVKNKVRGKDNIDSLKIGLNNLAERSLMILNKPLLIDSTGSEFIVSLPLIKYK